MRGSSLHLRIGCREKRIKKKQIDAQFKRAIPIFRQLYLYSTSVKMFSHNSLTAKTKNPKQNSQLKLTYNFSKIYPITKINIKYQQIKMILQPFDHQKNAQSHILINILISTISKMGKETGNKKIKPNEEHEQQPEEEDQQSYNAQEEEDEDEDIPDDGEYTSSHSSINIQEYLRQRDQIPSDPSDEEEEEEEVEEEEREGDEKEEKQVEKKENREEAPGKKQRKQEKKRQKEEKNE